MNAKIIDFIAYKEKLDNAKEWLVGKEQCRVCNSTAIATVHQEADLDNLECGKCHNMTSMMIELYDDNGEAYMSRECE